MNNSSKLDPLFWEERYRLSQTGWDIGEPAPPFQDYLAGKLAGLAVPAPGKLLVPGCGRGNDALFFAQQGFEVLGIDFAPSAIDICRARAAQDSRSHSARFLQHDLFQLPASFDAAFDYVAEHTCFCAIDPALRADYARTIHRLIRPGGKLIAVFFTHQREGGPPYRTSVEEIRRLFSPLFTLDYLEPATRSHRQRANEETFGLLTRPSDSSP